MAFPDASLNTQLEGGDSGVQNLFIYGKLNYNFDNEDLKVKSINISDKVTATSFTGTNFTGSFAGSGANLTEIPDNAIEALTAAKLTGALPAIDGSSLTGLDTFLKGMIILWYGDTSNIPNGFALCDGTNDTPELRDKFVVGASDSTGDSTYPGLSPNCTPGGSADATLVSHSHTTNSTIEEASSAAKSLTGSVRRISEGYRSQGFTTGIFTKVNDGANNITGSSSNSLVAGFTFDGTHRHGTDTQGSSGTNANLPPYYALCYIMKT